MRGDIHIDLAAVFQPVTPPAGQRQAASPGDRILEARHILRRTDVLKGHTQELFAAIAVMDGGCMIDLQEAQGLPVEHPHGQRVVLKEQPELRVLSLHRIFWCHVAGIPGFTRSQHNQMRAKVTMQLDYS